MKNLRPATVLAAASRLFTLMLNLAAVDRRIAHLLIVGSFFAMQDSVDLLDPTFVALAPETELIGVLRLRLKPVEIALRGRQKLEHEDTASRAGVM